MIQDGEQRWNLELPTFGGKQVCTDHRWWYGWRVQYNHLFDHWRLLDPKSIRKAWGTKEAMLRGLETIQEREPREDIGSTIEPERVLLLLHGLMRTSRSMKPLEIEFLHQLSRLPHQPKHAVIRFTYASTRAPILSHAHALCELVENLPGKPRFYAACHSLGNIVLRLAMAEWAQRGDPQRVLERFDRVVMLGPPNQGSSFAKRLSQLGLFELITGKSGMQLGPQWNGLAPNLGVPPCPFAVFAGDLSNSPIQNPLLDGPNDAIVTVEETKLQGMTEFRTYPVLHSLIMQDRRCVKEAIEFLLKPNEAVAAVRS